MVCISRRDKKVKNFLEETRNVNKRYNLYTQIHIENNTLLCVNESYSLEDYYLCDIDDVSEKPCTLYGTNEIVDIGYDENL